MCLTLRLAIADLITPINGSPSNSLRICLLHLYDLRIKRKIPNSSCAPNFHLGLTFSDAVSSILGEFGPMWNRMEVDLNADKPFQIVIEGMLGDGRYGDIAIDDITFTPECLFYNFDYPLPSSGQTTPQTTAGTTMLPNECDATNQFYCPSMKTCLPWSKQCDFRKDCPGASLEDQCGKNKKYSPIFQSRVKVRKSIGLFSKP